MLAVKSAFECLTKNIKNKKIFKIKSIRQNKKNEIRYTKISDFTDEILNKFKNKEINLIKRKAKYINSSTNLKPMSKKNFIMELCFTIFIMEKGIHKKTQGSIDKNQLSRIIKKLVEKIF